MLVWKVKRYDINANKIVDYNILNYKETLIKQLKKSCATKEEFSKKLRGQMQYYYWSRSEHELIIEVVEDRVILRPWSDCPTFMKAAIDVTDNTDFDWAGFAKYHIGRQSYGHKAKIDIFNMLEWRWQELIDYCWHTRLPYERKHEKFEK